MGFYSLVFTVPKNTPEQTPLEQKLPVSPGILHQVSVMIPPGHAGLTGCAIDAGLHQIAPTNQNAWFKGDDVDYSYPEYVELPAGITQLTLRGFNLDTANDHGFVIGVGIMPVKIYNALLRLTEELQPVAGQMAELVRFFGPPGSTGGG